MNTSYNRWHLVNSYGAFGSVTKNRYEIIVEGTREEYVGAHTAWQEYEFKGKPGDPGRRPRQFAPYHLRLDWLMWFAALSPGYLRPWFHVLVHRLLEGDPHISRLLLRDPFAGDPPLWIRARLSRYRFTTRAERRTTGDWWVRTPVGEVMSPQTLER